MKKHEAIEADISSYQERIQVVVELALEMESEGYYDTKRISAQKDNILRQWGLLTELVRARRARLEQNLALQKIFQEMVYMIDWMEEMQVEPGDAGHPQGGRELRTQLASPPIPQVLLVSKDLGKHLLEVEDLLQKHGLLEADISAQTERVQALNAAALKFSELEGNGDHQGGGHWVGCQVTRLGAKRVGATMLVAPRLGSTMLGATRMGAIRLGATRGADHRVQDLPC